MEQTQIAGKPLVCLIALFIMGNRIITDEYHIADKDTWIAVLVSAAVFLPVIYMYAHIAARFPGKNLYEMAIIVFGGVGGRIFNLIFALFSFQLGVLVLRDFILFVNIESLPMTPMLIIALCLAGLAAWVAMLGPGAIGRAAMLFFVVVIAMVILMFFLLIGQMHIQNLQPVFGQGIPKIGTEATLWMASPFGETVLFLSLTGRAKPGAARTQNLLRGYALGGASLILATLESILVLGGRAFSELAYPGFATASIIHIGGFLQRLEALVAIIYLLCILTKLAVCLFSACEAVKTVWNRHPIQWLPFVPGGAAAFLAAFLFPNAGDVWQWMTAVYPFYAIPCEIGLPLLLWSTAAVKEKRRNLGHISHKKQFSEIYPAPSSH